jgi:hypothetical protein
MAHEVYVHFLSGGPHDGDRVPNHRPWEDLVITTYCEKHKEGYTEMEVSDACPDCKKHKYTKFESNEFKEADCPGLEVVTQDGVEQAPIIHRVDMAYQGVVSTVGD